MKKRFNQLLFFGLIGATGLLASCDDNTEIIPDTPPADETIVINGSESMATDTSVNVSSSVTSKTVRLHFTSASDKMTRIYILQNVNAQGDEPYELEEDLKDSGISIDTKGDGALDISGTNGNDVTYEFDLPVPSQGSGTVVYTFWATYGKGDYRETDKRLLVGPATLTLNYGGSNDATAIKEYSATILAAPLDDGSSETFMSVFDGQVYALSSSELAAYWDLGYYYGNTNKASLSSPASYPKLFDHDDDGDPNDLVGIATLTNTPQADLNNFYFAETTVDFDAVTTVGDLGTLSVTTSDVQTVKGLVVGDTFAFLDNYGHKGIIKVTNIVSGFTGSITIAIKVQP
ncbi:hypothetical protein [Fulvivirga ligni]|uniref:hypothetical protein n=1 Tax=Fulvivirga ligni TaxID=2904246 RepID=UPI001F33FA49|nr:hypothetical protein [Fulvivirga ligni]UII19203.1 hypothetical protein LVD16_15260 [Fulvivirga ligni]